MEPAIAAPTKRTIGLKATSRGAAGVATITRISFSEDDDHGPLEAHISVRYGPEAQARQEGHDGRPLARDVRTPRAGERRA